MSATAAAAAKEMEPHLDMGSVSHSINGPIFGHWQGVSQHQLAQMKLFEAAVANAIGPPLDIGSMF